MKNERRFTDVKPLDPESVWALKDDSDAIINGRTMFPSRVVPALGEDRLLKSGENQRKIGKFVTKGPWKGARIFTLTLEERATCPTSCAQWRTCYGNGMQFSKRHEAGIDLENLLFIEVRDLLKKHEKIAIRLHVLGDFYSKQYVDVWAHMMKRFPGLHVFGFTARDRLDPIIGFGIHALNLLYPDRWVIRWSGSSDKMGSRVFDYVPEGNTEKGSFMCPAQTGKAECCGSCGLCWSEKMKPHPVGFVLHGATKRRKGVSGVTSKPDARKKRKNGWSDEHTETLRELWPGDLTLAEIGEQCGGRTATMVASKGNHLGLGFRKKGGTTWTAQVNGRFRNDWFGGLTLHQLSARYGRTVKAIVHQAERLKLGARDGDQQEQKKRETEDITGSGVNRNITLVRSVADPERFKVKIRDTESHL